IPLGVIFLHIIATGKHKLLWSKQLIGAVALSLALPVFWYGIQYSLYGRDFLNQHFSFVASKILGPGAVVRDDLRQKEVILCRTIGGQDFSATTPVDTSSRSDEGKRFNKIIRGFVEYPKLIL